MAPLGRVSTCSSPENARAHLPAGGQGWAGVLSQSPGHALWLSCSSCWKACLPRKVWVLLMATVTRYFNPSDVASKNWGHPSMFRSKGPG